MIKILRYESISHKVQAFLQDIVSIKNSFISESVIVSLQCCYDPDENKCLWQLDLNV